jgi:hypothetical protein
VVMREEDEELDILALVDAVNRSTEIPQALPVQDTEQWVDAETAGIPQRVVPPQPWTPREPNKQPVSAGGVNRQESISVVSVNINV